MEQLYDKYKNIQLFATSPEYRNYELLDDKFDDYTSFKNKIQTFEYILHKFKNPKQPERKIDLYLFKPDSKVIGSTTEFKKILDRYSKDHTLIMITKVELNVYRKKSVKQYTHLDVRNYLHKHFMIEINKGPLCSKHTVLTPDEVNAMCYNIYAHGHSLPAIFETDPQNIWIGGEIGRIVKIEPNSEITGRKIQYRIITPATGKIEQNPNTVIKKETSTEVPSKDDEDEPNEDYIDDYNEVDDE